MRFELTLREWTREVGQGWAGYFPIRQAGEYYRVVKISVPDVLLYLAGNSLDIEGEQAWEEPSFQRAVHRHAVSVIVDALQAGTIEAAVGDELFMLELTASDEMVAALIELLRDEKTCSYQERDSGNLFCTAASANDETALPIVMNNGRRVAPTSRPLCASCTLPDTDYICSHFLHPQVLGVRAMGGTSGFVRRDLVDGLCDLDRPEFASKPGCRAGGHSCWERIIEAESAPIVGLVSPQAIEQALDDLDVRWRLAFGQPVVRLPGAEDVSILALACSTRDEFERRLSSLADIIKKFDVSDSVLQPATNLPEKALTLARLETLFTSRLADEDQGQVMSAIAVLRDVNSLRVGGQHSGDARNRRMRAADSLGVPLDGRWGEAWERVRALAAQAIRDLGTAVRQVADMESAPHP